MALPEEFRGVAKRIKDRMSAHEAWDRKIRGLQPRWVGRLITSLVVAVGSNSADTVLYVSCSSGEAEFKVVIVTPRTIIQGVVYEPDEDHSGIDVRVTKRADVTSVSFSHSTSAFESESFVSWPGIVRLTLHHRELGEIRLPLGNETVDPADSDERERLVTELVSEIAP